MRLVIQRVSEASVSKDCEILGHIGRGLCVLIGIGDEDSMNDIQWCKDSVLKTKFWSGDDGKPWKKSLIDNNYELLIVSQFTLYGKIYKKGRLDFHHAMAPDAAKLLYDSVVQEFKSEIGADKVQTGEFGALMSVSITNDGPVTIILDSKEE